MPQVLDSYEPQEQKYTAWHNPLEVDQRIIVIENGRRVKYTVPAKKTVNIPSTYDGAIQQVICDDPGCRDKGGYCQRGHGGTVYGGLAPQLINRARNPDAPVALAKGLDTTAAERDQAQADLAAAELARRASENAALLAAQRVQQTEESRKPKGGKGETPGA